MLLFVQNFIIEILIERIIEGHKALPIIWMVILFDFEHLTEFGLILALADLWLCLKHIWVGW